MCACACSAVLPAEPEAAVCGAAMAPRWPSLLLLACALALLARHPSTAGPTQPTYPGDDAPVEDLVRFYNDLQQYLNMVTRHR